MNKFIILFGQFLFASVFATFGVTLIKHQLPPEDFTVVMWAIVLSFLGVIMHKLDNLQEWTELWNEEEEDNE